MLNRSGVVDGGGEGDGLPQLLPLEPPFPDPALFDTPVGFLGLVEEPNLVPSPGGSCVAAARHSQDGTPMDYILGERGTEVVFSRRPAGREGEPASGGDHNRNHNAGSGHTLLHHPPTGWGAARWSHLGTLSDRVFPTGRMLSPHNILVSLTGLLVVLVAVLQFAGGGGAGIAVIVTKNAPSSHPPTPDATGVPSTTSQPLPGPTDARVVAASPAHQPFGSKRFTDQQLISAMKPLANLSAFPAFQRLYNNLVVRPQFILPTLPWVQMSSDDTVAERGVGVEEVYKCFGRAADGSSTNEGSGDEGGGSGVDAVPSKFDFVFFPIGCQGEPRGKPCQFTTSCKLGSTFPKFLPCAKRRVAAILGDNFYPHGLTRKDRVSRLNQELSDKFTSHHPDMKDGSVPPFGSPVLFSENMTSEIQKVFFEGGPSISATGEGGGAENDPSEPFGMKFYATVGNHDNPKPHYQVHSDHPSWVMPSFHHVSPMMWTRSVNASSSSAPQPSTGGSGRGSTTTSVQLFLIDTHWGYGRNDPFMAAEASWLDEQLAKSKADWKIVGTHEPIHGFLGFDHGKGLVNHIHPILLKHKVRIFVCAHAHSVHMFKVPAAATIVRGDKVVSSGYYTLVSAGFADNVHNMAKPRRPPGYYHLGTGGVAVLINKDEAHVVAFSTGEKLIFAHRISRVPRGSMADSKSPEPVVELPREAPTNGSANVVEVAPPAFATVDAVDTVPPTDRMWRIQDMCEALKPYVPVNCQ